MRLTPREFRNNIGGKGGKAITAVLDKNEGFCCLGIRLNIILESKIGELVQSIKVQVKDFSKKGRDTVNLGLRILLVCRGSSRCVLSGSLTTCRA